MKHVGMEDLEKSDRIQFVRKVYSILAAQLSITCGMIIIVQTN